MKKFDKKLRRFLKYAILFIIIFGLLLTFTNLKRLKQHFIELNLICIIAAVICSFIIYGIEGLFLRISLQLFKEKLPILHSLKFSLIINSVGYFISFGGLTPFATQIHILDYYNITVQKATASRVLHVIFFNAFFNILLIAGLIAILHDNNSNGYNLTIIIFTVSFFFLLITGFYFAIFWKSFRRAAAKVVFTLINAILGIFTKKFKMYPKWAFHLLDEFNKGFRNALKEPLLFIILFIITVVDWIFWLAVMYFSFLTVNYTMKIESLIIGFSIGQIVSIISMVPGGAGTMEGSMALIYNILGVPLATALLAVLIYRFTFYIIPFFLSLPFYFSLKQEIEE